MITKYWKAEDIEWWELLDEISKTCVWKTIKVEVKQYGENRTNQQNRYLWWVVYKIISDELWYNENEVHDLFKAKYLRVDKYIEKDWKKINIPRIRSTTDLNTKEFKEYIDKIRDFVSINLWIYVPEANEYEEFKYIHE